MRSAADLLSRAERAEAVRVSAAALAKARKAVCHEANGEEHEHRAPGPPDAHGLPTADRPSLLATFTKGLPHDLETGLAKNPVDFQLLVDGIDSGDPADFMATPLGPAEKGAADRADGCPTVTAIRCDAPPAAGVWESDVANTGSFDPKPKKPKAVGLRAWESAGAGLNYNLEGPDPQAVTMPPAPRLDSPELAAEMAEVYAQALLRDTHVSHFRDDVGAIGPADLAPAVESAGGKCDPADFSVDDALAHLGEQSEWWDLADGPGRRQDRAPGDAGSLHVRAARPLTDAEKARLRPAPNRQTVFRGVAPGDQVGPYLSQFLLIGNSGINAADQERTLADGLISYGSLTIDQRVRLAAPCRDYMTTFAEYVDVQNAARVTGLEAYVAPADHAAGPNGRPGYRFLTTPRDLATYVHYDALYEAYLNACLLLLSLRAPFDPGLPFQRDDVADHQQGFAQFGPPHVLTLVCEVATRALKAVRFQKFNVHRRLRPEALAARLAKYPEFGPGGATPDRAFEPVEPLFTRLSRTPSGAGGSILDLVAARNKDRGGDDLALLPMAFSEGSPMHPSYGAGHAAVAGACVTILKAFFDGGTELWEAAKKSDDTKVPRPIYYEPTADGNALRSLVPAGAHAAAGGAGETATGRKKASRKGSGGKRGGKEGGKADVEWIGGGTVRSLGRPGPEQAPSPPTPFAEAALAGAAVPDYGVKPLTVEGELNKLAANISIGRDWAGVHYFTDYLESLRLGEAVALGILEEQKLTYRENFSLTVPLFDGGSVRI